MVLPVLYHDLIAFLDQLGKHLVLLVLEVVQLLPHVQLVPSRVNLEERQRRLLEEVQVLRLLLQVDHNPISLQLVFEAGLVTQRHS